MSKKRKLNNNQEMRDLLVIRDSKLSDLSDDDSIADRNYETFAGSSDDEAHLDEILEQMALEEDQEEEEKDDHEIEEPTSSLSSPIWSNYSGRQSTFAFTGMEGILNPTPRPDNFKPMDAFNYFVDKEVLQLLVNQTNLYAKHRKWTPTTKEELKTFFGILLWMGLDRRGTIGSYWSQSPLYKNEIAGKMNQHRFELLLNSLHFSNNAKSEKGDRHEKIQPLLDILVSKYKSSYCPGKDIVIDEMLIPWKGRLKFRQFIPNEAHKYGIKLFKLSSTIGFTYNLKIYSSKTETGEHIMGLAKNVCEELMSDLVNEGRTLYINNFYTSYELAVSLLKQKTHVVGTVRSSKKNMPKVVWDAKLNKGEIVSREDENGIVVFKWKDLRDVRMLSTRHRPHLEDTINNTSRAQREDDDSNKDNDGDVPVASNNHSADIQKQKQKVKRKLPKPEAVLAYNKAKTQIDLSDQMATYATTLTKGVKWYRKLGIELLLGISILNAHVIYQEIKGMKMPVRTFRENISLALLGIESGEKYKEPKENQIHVPERLMNYQKKEMYRSCKICYQKLCASQGRAAARKKNQKSKYFCSGCPNKPVMCLTCFTDFHKKH